MDRGAAAHRYVTGASSGRADDAIVASSGAVSEGASMADLGVGRKVSYFELPDQQDYPWSLSGQLEAGPVVLVFYRGDW
jgi:hypothetical protein